MNDPLVTDLVAVENEQVRYILDTLQDFLPLGDGEYIPNYKKPNFEEWYPGGGVGAEVTLSYVDALIRNIPDPRVSKIDEKIEKLEVKCPSCDCTPNGINPKAIGIWKKLLGDEKFSTNLMDRPIEKQWALANYVFKLRCLKHGKNPYIDWDSNRETQFEKEIEEIRNKTKQ